MATKTTGGRDARQLFLSDCYPGRGRHPAGAIRLGVRGWTRSQPRGHAVLRDGDPDGGVRDNGVHTDCPHGDRRKIPRQTACRSEPRARGVRGALHDLPGREVDAGRTGLSRVLALLDHEYGPHLPTRSLRVLTLRTADQSLTATR